MKLIKKYYWVFGIIILVTGFIIYNYAKAYHINTTLSGVECRIGDSKYLDKVTIKVKGTYYKSLFQKDSFDGTISIDKYDYTNNPLLSSCKFFNGYAILHYYDSNLGTMKSLGTLFCAPDFNQMMIFVDEPTGESQQGWGSENGLFIAAPANNREQAINIAKSYSSKVAWIKNMDWDK